MTLNDCVGPHRAAIAVDDIQGAVEAKRFGQLLGVDQLSNGNRAALYVIHGRGAAGLVEQ